MRLSFRYRFVFLANPRCGSTSVRAALDRYADLASNRRNGIHPHSRLEQVETYLAENAGPPIDDFAVLTTCRNPWERTVSIYHFGLANPQSIWHLPAIEAGSFRTF